jgi:hypothetical protein
MSQGLASAMLLGKKGGAPVKTVLDRATAGPHACESAVEFWTREYLLRHCEGYVVDRPEGCRVGFVSEVVETDDVVEFLVEGSSGEFRVPVDAIDRFDARGQRITLAVR